MKSQARLPAPASRGQSRDMSLNPSSGGPCSAQPGLPATGAHTTPGSSQERSPGRTLPAGGLGKSSHRSEPQPLHLMGAQSGDSWQPEGAADAQGWKPRLGPPPTAQGCQQEQPAPVRVRCGCGETARGTEEEGEGGPPAERVLGEAHEAHAALSGLALKPPGEEFLSCFVRFSAKCSGYRTSSSP